MSNLFKCRVCPSCNQVITDKGRGAIEKHSETVFKLYGYTFKELQTKNKTGCLVYARQYFWLLLITEDGWSLPRAAKATGHDHTTALHGVRKLAQELLNLPPRSPVCKIIKAYWLAAGMDEESANAKAQERRQGGR